ncbi:monodechloroaminopyrrolnitrin synthase PrnB family protein [Micromonospora sp. NPDC049559]|uniref:monodechloroaminopyrrolnitrin synthase PrnB family protein n=1 Tax=Micromonospora sp. NPDC049559 TaxID=3155923 RepID=UPI00342CC1E0
MTDSDSAIERFHRWLRHEFVGLNTELEKVYLSAGGQPESGRPELDGLRHALARGGADLVGRIRADAVRADARQRYLLLGAIGFHLAACHRHGVDVPAAERTEALADRLGASLGVAPRYVFAHQSRYGYRTFTSLPDEHAFVAGNGLGVLAYDRAARALRAVPAVGISSPLAGYLLRDAAAALADVLRFHQELARTLDADVFYHHIRPYYLPYRVGGVEYRGVNAGDFAAISEIDLLLGLCAADDPFYRRVLDEKYRYVPPEDQSALRSVVTEESLLELFLREAAAGAVTPGLRANAGAFLAVCRAHGAAYAYHHHRLVRPFLAEPARGAPAVTASGPPLDVVVRLLGRLADLRAARDRPGAPPTARAAIDRLRALLDPAEP